MYAEEDNGIHNMVVREALDNLDVLHAGDNIPLVCVQGRFGTTRSYRFIVVRSLECQCKLQ